MMTPWDAEDASTLRWVHSSEVLHGKHLICYGINKDWHLWPYWEAIMPASWQLNDSWNCYSQLDYQPSGWDMMMLYLNSLHMEIMHFGILYGLIKANSLWTYGLPQLPILLFKHYPTCKEKQEPASKAHPSTWCNLVPVVRSYHGCWAGARPQLQKDPAWSQPVESLTTTGSEHFQAMRKVWKGWSRMEKGRSGWDRNGLHHHILSCMSGQAAQYGDSQVSAGKTAHWQASDLTWGKGKKISFSPAASSICHGTHRMQP